MTAKKFPHYAKYAEWPTKGLIEEDGIVVGCTASQEYLLPWWWLNYRLHNFYPVTFIDFDMTPRAKEWCQKKGTLISLNMPDDWVAMRDQVPPEEAENWEKIYTKKFWPTRIGWFKKPFALLNSPFKRSVWYDLDCQIVKSLEGIFDFATDPSTIGLAPTTKLNMKRESMYGLRYPDEIIWNSGVIVYQRGAPAIKAWAEDALENNKLYIGDQHQLSRLLYNHKEFKVENLPHVYNWRVRGMQSKEAIAHHWLGSKGKSLIASQMLALMRLNINVLF